MKDEIYCAFPTSRTIEKIVVEQIAKCIIEVDAELAEGGGVERGGLGAGVMGSSVPPGL